jgi:hypothetical protein
MMHDANAFQEAIARDLEARETFAWMRTSHRAAFAGWVQSAPSAREHAARVRAAVAMLGGRDCVRRN